MYIYILLILASILLIINHFLDNKNKNNKKIINEEFNFYETNNNTPNYVKHYLNKKVSSHPDYNTENINQFNYDRIFNKLELINEEKIQLEGPFNHEKYIISTIDDKLRRDLDNITEYVLLILNQDTYYNFSHVACRIDVRLVMLNAFNIHLDGRTLIICPNKVGTP